MPLFQAGILVPFMSYREQTMVNHLLRFQQPPRASGFHSARLAEDDTRKPECQVCRNATESLNSSISLARLKPVLSHNLIFPLKPRSTMSCLIY